MRSPSLPCVPVRGRWLGIGGLLAVTLAATELGGPAGLVLGGILAVSWLRLPPEYTVALGQFGLAVIGQPHQHHLELHSNPLPLGLLALGELGLVGLLLTPPGATPRQGPTAIGVTASAVGVGLGVGWWSVTTGTALWVVSGGLLAAGGGLVYLGVVYARWRLPQSPARAGVAHE